jgi:hypothetical protein
VFIDESGDFGSYQHYSPYYFVAMVFHDQKNDISRAVLHLDEYLHNSGFNTYTLHAGPIIRREQGYVNITLDERKSLLNALINFSRFVDVNYITLKVEKKNFIGIINLTIRLSKQIKEFVQNHHSLFEGFDEVIIYYDYGQAELTKVITSTFTALLSNVSFHKVKPIDYKLFQLADMFCYLELVAVKFENNMASLSEKNFFNGKRDFTKDYLKKIRKKRLD